MDSDKLRSDQPSGRQATEQPEHAGTPDIDPANLHQGQGPDFQTQDSRLKKKNPAVKELDKNLAPGSGNDSDPANEDSESSSNENEEKHE